MQTQIDSHKRAFLTELEALLEKYDVKIAGYSGGFEAEDGCVELQFNDGSFLTYSPVKPNGVECIVDASRVFDFD